MIKQQDSSLNGVKSVVSELKAIKRLLALMLLQQGTGQQQVAKAAGVATVAINQLANVGGGKQKGRGRR